MSKTLFCVEYISKIRSYYFWINKHQKESKWVKNLRKISKVGNDAKMLKVFRIEEDNSNNKKSKSWKQATVHLASEEEMKICKIQQSWQAV